MKNIKHFLLLAGILILISSCGSYSSMQTAKTTPQGTGEIGVNIFYPYGVINAIAEEIDEDKNSKFTIPYIQGMFKYGLTNKWDVGFNISTFGQLGLESKYMILGDQDSKFAIAPGFGFNTFFFYYYDFQVPLHMSYHPAEKWGIFLSPKYIGQFVSKISVVNTYFDYAGFSGGIMYGDRVKVGAEVTAVFPLNAGARVDIFPNIYNFGIGAKWSIGQSKSTSNKYRRF